MAPPVKNGTVIFKEIPSGYPVPGQTVVYDQSETLDLDNVPLEGGILTKVLVLSIDPYLRHKMQAKNPLNPLGNFELNQPLENFGVGVVLRSDNPKTKAGDHVYGMFPFKQYAIFKGDAVKELRVIENKEGIPWSAYVGVCGMPGQTAHHGWTEFAKPVLKKGDVAFVTAASGAVGAVVVQLAKLSGLKVIASAGSDAKVEFVRSLGADVVFNYKTTSTMEVLKREGPINIYWDNVGGESLEAALEYAAHNAHFLICGMISTYNTKEPYNVKNLQNLLWREITFHGFLGASLMAKYDKEFYGTFPALVASGKLQHREHRVQGLENVGQAILDVLSGSNTGKMVVTVSED
ncbi:NAD(P)-binding protein [Daedaleopsis nitida]|nr:NAD(P)-binding protein [Daedaleopsis nitida]